MRIWQLLPVAFVVSLVVTLVVSSSMPLAIVIGFGCAAVTGGVVAITQARRDGAAS